MTSITRCLALSVLLAGCTPEPGVEAEPPGRELNDPPPAPEGELVLDDAWTFIRGEHFGQESGSAIAVGDLTGDGLVDLVVNAPGRAQDVETEDSGHSVYVFAGPLDAGRIDGGAADLGIAPPSADRISEFGRRIALGDLDGDGDADLVVEHPVFGEGAVFVFYGPLEESRTADEADARIRATGDDGWHYGLPTREWSLGDFDGDGDEDLVLQRSGEGLLVFDAPRGNVDREDAVARIDLDSPGQVSTGDLDGDGRDDLVVAADGDEVSGAHVFAGPLQGRMELDDAVTVVEEAVSFAVSGDLDGDGRADLLVQTDGDEVEGRAVVAFSALPQGMLTLDDAWTVLVDPPRSTFAAKPLSTGDLNSDGWVDVVVDDSIFYGPFETPRRGDEASVVLPRTETGLAARLLLVDDLTFDGVDDLLLTMPDYMEMDESGNGERTVRPHGAVAVFPGGRD